MFLELQALEIGSSLVGQIISIHPAKPSEQQSWQNGEEVKKYKIIVREFHPVTKAESCCVTMTTELITVDQLEQLVRVEAFGKKNVCWTVTPWPNNFHERFE